MSKTILPLPEYQPDDFSAATRLPFSGFEAFTLRYARGSKILGCLCDLTVFEAYRRLSCSTSRWQAWKFMAKWLEFWADEHINLPLIRKLFGDPRRAREPVTQLDAEQALREVAKACAEWATSGRRTCPPAEEVREIYARRR